MTNIFITISFYLFKFEYLCSIYISKILIKNVFCYPNKFKNYKIIYFNHDKITKKCVNINLYLLSVLFWSSVNDVTFTIHSDMFSDHKY